jgi:hypothetical protein
LASARLSSKTKSNFAQTLVFLVEGIGLVRVRLEVSVKVFERLKLMLIWFAEELII